jgi:hypothetical protein
MQKVNPRTRTEPSKEEIKIRQEAISSTVKKCFLKEKVSFVEAKELPFLVGRVRQTDGVRAEIRRTLLDNFGASIVSVGNGMVAIVKRPSE